MKLELQDIYFISSIAMAIFAFFTLISSVISLWNTIVSNNKQKKLLQQQNEIQKNSYNLSLLDKRYEVYKDFYKYSELLNQNPFYQFKSNEEFMAKIQELKEFEEIVICKLKLFFDDEQFILELDKLIEHNKVFFDSFIMNKDFRSKLTGNIQKDAPLIMPLIQERIKMVENIKKQMIKLMKI